MRHLVDGRKFGVNTSHRKAMFKALANNLIRHEQITTTVQKAKELRRVIDRLITLGKKNSLHAKRLAFARTRDGFSVGKLFGTLAERYSKRAGGYTRVLKRDGTQWGDGAELAVIELVDRPIIERKKKTKKEAKADGHDHAHDHKHAGHDHGEHEHKHPEQKQSRRAMLTDRIKGSTGLKGKGKPATVRKTPTQSSGGGNKSGGSS